MSPGQIQSISLLIIDYLIVILTSTPTFCHTQKNHPDVASSYLNIGGAHYYKGNLDTALNYVTKAVDTYSDVFGLDHPKATSALSWADLIRSDMEEEDGI